MKKEYLLLLIIPVCFIILSKTLRNIEGPYYNGLADPSYVYLINSLSLAQMNGYGVGHTDHPGTPVQITGAIVIKIFHTFDHEKVDLAEDVFYRPEVYLNAINFVLIILNAAALFLMGVIIYNVKNNIFISLFFQSIPFVSLNITEVFSLFKTESFVFSIAVIFIALVIKFVYDPSAKIKNYTFIFGLLGGLILAAKISFLCLLVIPLILIPGFKKKVIFLVTVFFSFIICILPAMSNAGYFINWISGLIFNDGRYGKGSPSILDFQSFSTNLTKIFINEKFFALVYFLILAVLILMFFIRRNGKENLNMSFIEIKLLLAIFLAMSLNVIMVAKHYSHRYMFPALLLTIPGLFVVVTFLYKKYFPKLNANIVYASMLVLILLFGAYISRKIIARTKTKASETVKLYNFLNEKYPDAEIILSSGVSNEAVGVILGYFYSSNKAKHDYLKLINERFPDNMWYDIFNDKLYSFSPSVKVGQVIISGKKILLHTNEEKYTDSFVNNLKVNLKLENIELTQVFSNANGEQLFLLSE